MQAVQLFTVYVHPEQLELHATAIPEIFKYPLGVCARHEWLGRNIT